MWCARVCASLCAVCVCTCEQEFKTVQMGRWEQANTRIHPGWRGQPGGAAAPGWWTGSSLGRLRAARWPEPRHSTEPGEPVFREPCPGHRKSALQHCSCPNLWGSTNATRFNSIITGQPYTPGLRAQLPANFSCKGCSREHQGTRAGIGCHCLSGQ